MTFVHQSAKIGRYVFAALTLTATLAAVLHWGSALFLSGSLASAFVWSVLAGLGALCIMVFERVEMRGA